MRRLLGSVVVLAGCAGAPAAKPAPPPCGADANIVLRAQDDVDAAARCLTVASLTIRTGASLDLRPLAKLHEVLGELRVGPTVGFVQLDLPALASAGAITIAGNGDLHGIALPRLASARSVVIESNVALTTITMPRLAKVAEALTIAGHADLGLIELSSLASVGGELAVTGNPALTLLELGTLAHAGAIRIENNGALDASFVDAVRSKAAR